MEVNLQKYYSQFGANVELAKKAIEKTINSTAVFLFNDIIAHTPLGNPALWQWPAAAGYTPGHLRASWGMSYLRGAGNDRAGQAVGNSIGQIKVDFKGGMTGIVIYNIAPYAYRVEYGAWSSQKPEGMMRVAVANYEGVLERSAKQFRTR
jgi:hypothetical protein